MDEQSLKYVEREVHQIMIHMYIPEKPRKRCTGFSYIGPKLYNMTVLQHDTKGHKRSEDKR